MIQVDTMRVMCGVALVSALVVASGCGGDNNDKKDPVLIIDVDAGVDMGAQADMADPGCTSDAECVGDPAGPMCNTTTGACQPRPVGALLAGGAAQVAEIYTMTRSLEAPDLAFHPERDELWVVNRRPEVEGICSQSGAGQDRCQSLAGLTTIITAPGTADQSAQVLEDGNSWHFMRRPPTIAMGTNDMFATCGEALTGNFEDDGSRFIGPTLWTSDLSIYAKDSGGNGSHMDMLHATPWCMGIAHERDNIYWTFNGQIGSLDRYDFKEDHGPGADDHSDGEIYRYAEGTVSRVENVPSHMFYSDDDKMLYVADTGNARIIALNTQTGTGGRSLSPVYEPLGAAETIVDSEVRTIVPAGTLTQPSGLVLHEGTLYVGDHATGIIHSFSLTGEPGPTLDTGVGAGELAGLDVSPDGRLWFTAMYTGKVYRLDP